MDVHDSKTRSYNMSCIKGKRTKPEEIVARYLFSQGFRYRRNVRSLPGTPDIVLKKYNTVIFVNGCFWHMHENCRYSVMPENHKEFWAEKLLKNKERDEKKKCQLEQIGWNVIVVWECQLKGEEKLPALEKLKSDVLKGGNL